MVNTGNVKGSSGFVPEFTSKSVPNFERCVLEQGIGHELRVISDSFYLEFSGFVSISCDPLQLCFLVSFLATHRS